MKVLYGVLFSYFLLGLSALTVAANTDVLVKQQNGPRLKYIEFDQLGNPAEVLHIKEEDSRTLKNGEIRVKVLAAPINPSDLLQITGNYGSDLMLPFRPGSEGVGQVIELSEKVKHLRVGQLVLLIGGGTWSQQIVAPASQFLPLPNLDSFDEKLIEQLAMSLVNPATAFLMLTSFKKLKEGQWLVQSAANSAVGGYIIQLAKQRGVKTVNIVRRKGLAKDLIAKGADVVLIDGPNLVKEIMKATDNAPIVLGLDPVGGETFSRLANSLNHGGTLIAYGVLSGKPAYLNTAITIFKDIRIRGFWLSKWYEEASSEEIEKTFEHIIPLIMKGDMTANVDSRFTIDEINQAVSRAAQSGRNGKVLILPGGK